LRLLGCGAEALGAGVLAGAPEPTLLSKAGSLALAAHAADQCTTGATQLWSGRDQNSLSERAASAVARNLGASPATVASIGAGVDIAVPFAAAAGAARALAVRTGQISLARHEAAAGSRLGGHTIARHVGQSEAQLRARLAATASRRYPPPAISTFDDLAAAERSVSAALRVNRAGIQT